MTGGTWILGLNFFENYYTIFDQETYKVGFVLRNNATKRMQELVFNETKDDNKTTNYTIGSGKKGGP